jgi:dienelactone hydrolase
MNFETNRRAFLQTGASVASLSLLDLHRLIAAEGVPQTVAELWADFDPRRDPLEAQVVREWKEDGGVYRYVRYLIGIFKGKPARMAAFYGFPEGAKGKLPAVMHMHGGGQRAFLEEVKTYVGRGYAALSVNWGGREMENAKPGDPNTDWGSVDPTQQNVPGYFNLLPGDKFLVDHESPKNNNWYLLTLGCRRGITFLEQQPEVDAARIGIFGHSMGGNLTMYVAGTDDRVKVAAPSVGGQGYRTEPHEMMGGKAQQENIKGDTALFARTLGFENYAPRIHCPVMHLSGTNDFHGWMDDVYRTNALIQDQPLRYAFSPHLNHRFIPEVAITRPLWLDHYLNGGPALPEKPKSEWELKTADGVPVIRVMPDAGSLPVARVDIYYSTDPDPRARFWRDAGAVKKGDSWEAKLLVLSTTEPLYAFANAYHTLPNAESLPHLRSITGVCLSSLMHSATSADLKAAGVKATDAKSLLIEDFARGWHDWYRLNAEHKPFWQNWTRKITDPKWRGPEGARLAITLTMPETNTITIVMQENEWRSYRGKKATYTCRREINGAVSPQTLSLSAADFKTGDGVTLKNWSQLDQLGICAQHEERERGKQPEPAKWMGDMPTFYRLEWQMR